MIRYQLLEFPKRINYKGEETGIVEVPFPVYVEAFQVIGIGDVETRIPPLLCELNYNDQRMQALWQKDLPKISFRKFYLEGNQEIFISEPECDDIRLDDYVIYDICIDAYRKINPTDWENNPKLRKTDDQCYHDRPIRHMIEIAPERGEF
jgi:hypothetical protein